MKTKGFSMDETFSKDHANEERMDVAPPKLESLLAEFDEYSLKLPVYKFRELGLEKGQMDVQTFVTWLDIITRTVKKVPAWTYDRAVDILIEAGLTVEAVKVLLKLKGHEKFSGQAILMYRYFAENVPTDSDAMVQVWRELKLNPHHVFESLLLNDPEALIAFPGSSIHWLKYTERLRKDNADIQMTIKDTAMALYNKEYDRTIIDGFIKEVEKVNDLKLLAQRLRQEFEYIISARFFNIEY
ncbi:unnamed protein product [Hyaloperonospora brassicae]|uniref:RxLR effector candidate protein n=1 Tax=Hyaloperonospora brassicae TaxID=162125 RepID=A0AAV0T4V7_HYABA|nr:unnamed protein product [Hyaloperonospora brassicae]